MLKIIFNKILFSFAVFNKGNGNKDIKLNPQVNPSIIENFIFFEVEIISITIAKQK